MEQLKEKWNKGLKRVHDAEKVAKENPELFEKYLKNFNELCKEMSKLMNEYEKLTGKEMSKDIFNNGFKQGG